ncbi:glycosyltransferase family 4 protein, partial [bacterium]|nr:glycosyltransferase family 4 protein [bacterium]
MRIAFVIQRYGENITGGSESLCRQITERLASRYEVEVITSCAEDYITWNNIFEEGIDNVNGIRVRRFRVVEPRYINSFNQLSNEVLLSGQPFQRQEEWVVKQGPHTPEILRYIKENKDKYDVFIFFTYLYYPTYFGLQLVPEKSIFVPTAHNEPAIYLDIYKALFFIPRGIAFNTSMEKELVHQIFKNKHIPWEVTGTGIEEPQDADVEGFKRKYGIKEPYILNMGRIEEGKGSKKLLEYFCKFKGENDIQLDLVLIGQLLIDIGKRDDVRFLGYISEGEKFGAIKGAETIMVPSPFESLALAQLEAWSCKRPTVSAAECDVTKAHAKDSGGGLVYSNYEEFVVNIKTILKEKSLGEKLGESGFEYVKKNY